MLPARREVSSYFHGKCQDYEAFSLPPFYLTSPSLNVSH